jgi:hypothetical protein
MASAAEIAAQQRAQQRIEEQRRKAATQSPLRSSGGGGFQPAIKAQRDPSFDHPDGHGPSVPLPTDLGDDVIGFGTGKHFTASDLPPKNQPAPTRKSFGVGEGDQ